MTTKQNPHLAAHVAQLGDIPSKARTLYESDRNGDGYVLTQLANLRRLAAENPGLEVPAPRKVLRLDRAGWAQLLATAEPAERAYLVNARLVQLRLKAEPWRRNQRWSQWQKTIGIELRIAQGPGKRPTMILMRGSGGFGANVQFWVRHFNAHGHQRLPSTA